MYGVLTTERPAFLTTTKIISEVPDKYSDTDFTLFEGALYR